MLVVSQNHLRMTVGSATHKVVFTDTRCCYEVTWMILFQACLYAYILLRGVIFEVFPLSNYALEPTMLPLLEIFFLSYDVEWLSFFFLSLVS
jgi:hypothetical protein